MIELYIENRKIDLADDIDINFTYEELDPQKLSSVKNSFSKTLSVPGTANNNITFGHIFRMDKYIMGGMPGNICNDYDPHKRVNYILSKNGALVNQGYCTLNNIKINGEHEVNYELTLYGGLGEFFYSLSYDENGNQKTLYDMFYQWMPFYQISTLVPVPVFNPDEEDSESLMACSPANVAWSLHSINPFYTYEGYTMFNKDVCFVPCYSGIYEDFDSSHMIVNTKNSWTTTAGMSSSNKANFLRSFPESLQYNNKTYTTIGEEFSSIDDPRYGLVKFSREIDPFEAGDLRINEMPLAIRLSKLMTVISNPVNNGGYEVEWDDEITNSLQWLYGWIVLGKLKQEKNLSSAIIIETSQYDNQLDTFNMEVSQVNGIYVADATHTASSTVYELSLYSSNLPKGEYTFEMNVIPCFGFQTLPWFNNTEFRERELVSGSIDFRTIGGTHGQPSSILYYPSYTVSILVHNINDGSTIIKTIADCFFFRETGSTIGFGTFTNEISTFKNYLKSMVETYLGRNIDEISIHNCNFNRNVQPASTNYYVFQAQRQKIFTGFSTNADTDSFAITQEQLVATVYRWSSSNLNGMIWGVDQTRFNTKSNVIRNHTEQGMTFKTIYSSYSPFGYVSGNLSYWPFFAPEQDEYNNFRFSFKIAAGQNGIFDVNTSSGFAPLNIMKQELFANSSSPFKYLVDYCKMMNYKFICDNISKKISIKPMKRFYTGEIYDIENKVDYSREIVVKPVTAKDKMIEFGLSTPETYPVYLFNKLSKDKFNTLKKDTGIEYNATTSKLLDNLIFKNTIDWQQSSIFYNIHPQMPRAWSQQSISWTLFNIDSQDPDNIDKHEFYTPGSPSNSDNLLAKDDFLPKISLFDKDNKEVSEAYPTLIFLNGFVKNYDHTPVESNTLQTVNASSTNARHYVNNSGLIVNSNYQTIYIYDIKPDHRYFVTTSQYGSGYGSYVVNYWNSTDGIMSAYKEYAQSGNSYSAAELHIPAGATKIYCNFLSNDTNAKLETYNINYYISPRTTFSLDTAAQYSLNGSRCYMNNFSYDDTFESWGCYGQYYAASWALPMFSRDLYNTYIPDISEWEVSAYKLASWNLCYQEGIDSLYSLLDTKFLKKPDYNYQKSSSSIPTSNEYSINQIPVEDSETRIFNNFWESYFNEIYNTNTREVTLWADLSSMTDSNQIMRTIYKWKGHYWILEKIENFRIADIFKDKFTKIKLLKIIEFENWTE